MKITVENHIYEFSSSTTVAKVIESAFPENYDEILACFCGNKVLELSETLSEDCELSPITYSNEEGRRIYERSLRFVMLMAVQDVLPGKQVRIEHSLGNGLYVRIIDYPLSRDELEKIEAKMREIVSLHLPFTRERWTKAQAIDYFAQKGEKDKAELLLYRPYDFFNVYRCGSAVEYFYGEMLPSTEYIKTFALRLLYPGFVMQMPDKNDFHRVAVFSKMPKHLLAFEQSNEWCRILQCTNAVDINRFIENKQYRSFIRVNEALHDKSIAQIADTIVERKSKAIFVAGPSSSGKTTFANRLCVHLRVQGLNPILISLDDFYRNKRDLPLEEDGQPDLESLHALDIPLLKRSLFDLLSGKEAMMPKFDFKTSTRLPDFYPLRLNQNQQVIFEGIHGLNPELHSEFNNIFKIFVSELTCLNLDNHNRIRTTDARLLRRIVRDYLFRNTPADETMMMWPSVRRGEEKWIFPFQEQADVVFNTVLHYELPVMKLFAYDLLKEIQPDNPTYKLSRSLLKMLHYFVAAPKEALNEIPPLSILREFVGGCTFYDPD